MRGKSGLQTDKVPWKCNSNQGGRELMESATENNRLERGKGEKVR